MAQDKKKGSAQDLMLPFLSEKKIMGSDGGNPTPNPDFVRAMQAQQDSLNRVEEMQRMGQNELLGTPDTPDPYFSKQMREQNALQLERDFKKRKELEKMKEPISMNNNMIQMRINKQEASKRYAYSFGLPQVMDLLGMEFVSFDERGEEIV
tara:strand:+ start:649 stop:1101 length:453 start_codon:yes stop_codon:yes gene_type:complete